MKKIIPSICMLLVTAVLMGTSTYAWFSMNKKVEVTGMKVTANTSSNLVISKDKITFEDSTKFNDYTLTFADATAKLNPVSSINGKQFFKANSAALKPEESALPTGAKFEEAANTPTEIYYIEKTIYIAVKGVTDLGQLSVSADIEHDKKPGQESTSLTTEQKAIYKALRIAVAYVDDTIESALDEKAATLLTANTEKTSWEGAKGAGPVADNKQTVSATAIKNSATITALNTLTANKCYRLVVRIWLEGQDENCFANNANTAAQVLSSASISLVFTAA